MKINFLKAVAAVAALAMAMGTETSAQTGKTGYYKDIFMDSGIMMNKREDLPAARFLNLTMERICTQENMDTNAVTAYDRQRQAEKFVGSPVDENGVLLYPDGAPRFRVYYMNGGKGTAHGKSVTPEGLANIRQFNAAGGSVVGTCAGAFIASKGTTKDSVGVDNPAYLGVYKGYTNTTLLYKTHTALSVEKGSPLLRYYDFGGDMKIDSVRHNGGCFLPREKPEGTEILLRYDCDTLEHVPDIRDRVNAWAYKESAAKGRVVLTGSHPEAIDRGEQLQMFAAMLRYAMDGNGEPVLKAELESGVERVMSLYTHDGDPAHTRIGDKQYHHYCIKVPKKASYVQIDLRSIGGWKDYDLYLYASDSGMAFDTEATSYNIAMGVDKTMTVPAPKSGKLYISVYCDTTVDVVKTIYGEQYTGRTDVLNGVPYSIKATIIK